MARAGTVDDASAWMIVASGELLLTTDGGKSWSNGASLPHFDLEAALAGAQFISKSQGFGLTSTGLVLTTTDFGKSWNGPLNGNVLQWIQFLDASNGYGVDKDDQLVATSDGGKTWTQVNVPGRVTAACFQSTETGFVAVDSTKQFVLLRTDDSGQTWSQSIVTDSRGSAQISCTSRSVVVNAFYGAGTVESTSTNGLKWATVWQDFNPATGSRVTATFMSVPASSEARAQLTASGPPIFVGVQGSTELDITALDATLTNVVTTKQIKLLHEVGQSGYESEAIFFDAQRGAIVVSNLERRGFDIYETGDRGVTWSSRSVD